jgi:hypothetical protein
LLDALQQFRLLGREGYRHAHEAPGEANVREDPLWFVMEVQKIPIVEMKYRRAGLTKRWMSAQRIQKWCNSIKRTLLHW